MGKFDVRRDVPVIVAGVVAAFLVGLLCFHTARDALGGRALGEVGTKCVELASLPLETGRARAEELASEIEFLGVQVRDASRTGVWVGIVAGVGFLAVTLVAHFFVMVKSEGGTPPQAVGGGGAGPRSEGK